MGKQTRSFSKRKHQHFIDTVWRYYKEHQRTSLPWRQTDDPYRVVVSELMLQQTQVIRVIPKYRAFLQQFPNTKQLAQSSLAAVITAWQGLGYNRRAKLLHECAQVVHSDYYGRWPRSVPLLEKLPGIGPYTASAVTAFAYNQPAVCVETNIRTAVIYHYFPKETEISEAAIRDVIRATLDMQHPREWYWALMDYGAHLKRTRGNFNRQARSYTKQSRFAGSDREIRGAIIRSLTTQPVVSLQQLVQAGFSGKRVQEQLRALNEEGFIELIKKDSYQLRS